jgi:hypothetical protein
MPSDGYKYTKEDFEVIEKHKYWGRGTHFGDPAGRFTSQVTNQSVISKLKEHGIIVNFRDEWKGFQVRKDAAKDIIMDGIDINKNPRTDYFNLCMISAAYPSVKNAGIAEIKSFEPKHNWTSHYRSAFEYLALGVRDYVSMKRKVYDKFEPQKTFNRFKDRRALRY